MQKNILVTFGGRSVEHEISIITGVLALNSADRERYNIIPAYITREGIWYTGGALFNIDSFKNLDFKSLERITLTAGSTYVYKLKKNKLKELASVDCVLNCCHGGGGEDGSLAGLFNLCGLASASPDVCGAAAAMDKSVTKLIAKALQIKTVPALKLSRIDYEKRRHIAEKYITDKIGFPVIVKPVKLGSSIGVSTANCKESLKKAVETAFLYDDVVLTERLLKDMREINCAAYFDGDDVVVSECEEPSLIAEFLTFEDKYLSGEKRARNIPAQLDEKLSSEIKSVTKQLYKRLNLKGIVRADFLIENGEVYFNELNTVPGSLAYYLFCTSVSQMGELTTKVIEAGIALKEKEKELLTDFAGEVLSKLAVNGGKCLKKR